VLKAKVVQLAREKAALATLKARATTNSRQGLTLVHFSAQRKHVLSDTLAA